MLTTTSSGGWRSAAKALQVLCMYIVHCMGK
jgi:hypothetical protein